MSRAASPFEAFDGELGGMRLVEASAGTGKTWNLCVLYLRLLLERGLQVPEILVVTFTTAATAELRERIRGRIAQTLERLRGSAPGGADPFVDPLLARLRGVPGLRDQDLQSRLEQALQGFDEASILTIHGFCQRALSEAPFSTGMPMQLSLLADDGTLRQDVVHDFWRRRIAGSALSPALAAHLVDRKFTPQRLSELLARRLGKPLARQLWPDALDGPIAEPDPAALAADFAAARDLWQAQRHAIVQAVQQAQPLLHKTHFTPQALQQAVESWDRLLASGDPPPSLADLPKLDLLGSARFKPAKGQTLPIDPAFFDRAQALLDRFDARRDVLELQRLRLLRDLLDEAPTALRRAKREQRVQGFDDMLFNLHERLAAPGGAALARMLRRRFAAALIDEFQDTDPLQYAIFRAIYAGSDAPVFLVGDPKQAIYAFRHADLHTYLRARGDARAEYTLSQNQRSTPALLDGLNALFGANPRAFMLDGLDYRPVSSGDKPRTPLQEAEAQPPRAALQLWQLPRGDDGQPLPKAEAMQQALAACAAEIARLLRAAAAGDLRLGERSLAAGDIAVLVRSHAQGAAMRRALAALDVGSVELSQASVFDSPDAADLERVLAAVLEPQREPLLLGALATEAMGRDAAALQALAADEAALLTLIARFAGYRDTWLAHGVGRMLREWMRAEGVAARLLVRPDGERRLTNLRHLAECLNEAANAHRAPEALLRWLQAQRAERRRDDALQLRLESDRNLVQVVTIHKAKGLEYPLVFCPTLWDGYPGQPQGGEGQPHRDADGHAVVDFRVLPKAELDDAKRQQQLEGAAEAMRLIYVALTRAVHRCTLVVGSYTTHQVSTAQSGRSGLNWLVAGAGMAPQEWLANKLRPDAIDAAWVELARRHAPAVRLAPLPADRGVPLAPQQPPAEQVAALAPPARIAPPWWIGSYSSLMHGTRHEGAAVDHDLRIGAAAGGDAATLCTDDILRFPRGAVAGECLHALLERIDFGDASGWDGAVDAVLQRFTPELPPGDVSLRRRMLRRMLHDVLHAPLPGGMRLADVPRAHTLVEMEFHLPAPQLRAEALARTMQRLGHPLPGFGFGTLRGYLRGFIDLVFEHRGRYFVLDWKSNHLGDARDDYAGPALERAMTRHGYQLQALIYALALHRHLQQRLAQYRHERHFGGVLYLFLRGVRPDWTLADGSSAGVHLQRPPLQALQALSALLHGAEEAT